MSFRIRLLIFALALLFAASPRLAYAVTPACGSLPDTPACGSQPDTVALLPMAACEIPDSLALYKGRVVAADAVPTYAERSEDPDFWINRIRSRTYDIYDSDVIYPKFINFCVKVYCWADKFFNSYDTDYVQSTGKKWKIMLRNDNWTDAYSMHFRPHMNVYMLSNVSANIGPYLSFMAVSIGYQYNFSKIFGLDVESQKQFTFNFNTGLFTIDAHYSENNGGSIIRRFGDYDGGRQIHHKFEDLKLKSYGIDAYYFFNHKRFSRGAAYNFSKIQLRSQGSFIAGITANHQDIKMNFSSLPEEMQSLLPDERRQYNFIYNDYSFLLGYGYNWVFRRNWVYNVTTMPSVGFKHTFADSLDGDDTRFSLGLRVHMALTYNLNNWFFGANGFLTTHWHINSGFYFFNSLISWGFMAGLRF